MPVGRNTHGGPASSRQVCILNHTRCNQSVVAKGDGNPLGNQRRGKNLSAVFVDDFDCAIIEVRPNPEIPATASPALAISNLLGMHADLPLSAPVRTPIPFVMRFPVFRFMWSRAVVRAGRSVPPHPYYGAAVGLDEE